MLKKSEKGETSSSEQAAVVIIELVRYTRVISGTSMYQSCRVAISAAWRRSVVRWWRSVRAGGGWSVRVAARRGVFAVLGPLNIGIFFVFAKGLRAPVLWSGQPLGIKLHGQRLKTYAITKTCL